MSVIGSEISKRYLLKLSYIGTSYRGSQKHVNDVVVDVDSVQGAVEYALRKLRIHNTPNLVMAGRTDAGVHALCTTAHLDLEHKPRATPFVASNMVQMMNRTLINTSHEIRILSAHEVSKDFHARFSAKSRTYLYRIIIPKNPLDYRVPLAERNRALHLSTYGRDIDMERMRRGVELFCGTKDFMTFSARSHDKKNPERKRNYVRTLNATIKKAEPMMSFDPLSKNFNYWHIVFTSKSFLYNQIRRITGALIALGQNRISEEDIITMLQVPSHNNWNSCATPAGSHGLYLVNVDYDEEIAREISS